MIQLTLDLGQDLVAIIDRLVREDGKYITDDFGRRQAIANLLYENDHRSHQGGHQKAGDAKAGKAGDDELAAVRRERDALRKALKNERATRRIVPLSRRIPKLAATAATQPVARIGPLSSPKTRIDFTGRPR